MKKWPEPSPEFAHLKGWYRVWGGSKNYMPPLFICRWAVLLRTSKKKGAITPYKYVGFMKRSHRNWNVS